MIKFNCSQGVECKTPLKGGILPLVFAYIPVLKTDCVSKYRSPSTICKAALTAEGGFAFPSDIHVLA